MAKKRVEETIKATEEQPVLQDGEMTIDDSFDIPMKPVEMDIPEEPVKKESPAERFTAKAPKHTVNCLRNEKVIVRFIPQQSAMVH